MYKDEETNGAKPRTIRRILKAKLDDWCSTIEDVGLVADIKRDAIVTGGSIASLLLGEKINDFDIYFRTLDTTIKVAKHYVDKYNYDNIVKNNCTISPVVQVGDHENCKGDIERICSIMVQSSGIASSENVSDSYAYFEGASNDNSADVYLDKVFDVKDDPKEKYKVQFISQNAITLSNKIQLVIRFHGEPTKIHNNFDFIHACNYYEYKDDKLTLKQEALTALLSRTLIYHGSLYPIASLIRSRKFIQRGWKISAGEYLKMAFQLSELNLNDFNTLKNQLIGVDMAYYAELLSVIENIKISNPTKVIDSCYVVALIDKIYTQ